MQVNNAAQETDHIPSIPESMSFSAWTRATIKSKLLQAEGEGAHLQGGFPGQAGAAAEGHCGGAP